MSFTPPTVVQLSSTSTDAEVEAAYDDHASYEATESLDSARVFIQACRILLRRYHARMQQGPETTDVAANLSRIQQELDEAKAWVRLREQAGSSTNMRVRRPDW